MLRQVLTLGLLLVALPLFAAPLPSDALVDAGSRKLEAGDVKGALEDFKHAQEKAPKDPRPHFLRAVGLQKLGDPDGAERAFRQALALDPKLAEVRSELGALLTERKKFPEAVKELKAAIAAKPDLSDAWYNLGQALSAQKNCPDANEAFAKVTQLVPNEADGWINLSVSRRRCKQLQEAQAAAAQAVKVAPKSPQARVNLGLVLSEQGKHDDAVAALTVATQLKPDYGTAWWSLGLAELERKKFDAAIAALTRARELQPTAARISDLGVAYRDKGELPRAEALFREAITKDARYHPARWHLAQTLSAQGRCPDLERELAALPPAEGKGEPAVKLKEKCKSAKR
jgi:superkiller protein 3